MRDLVRFLVAIGWRSVRLVMAMYVIGVTVLTVGHIGRDVLEGTPVGEAVTAAPTYIVTHLTPYPWAKLATPETQFAISLNILVALLIGILFLGPMWTRPE